MKSVLDSTLPDTEAAVASKSKELYKGLENLKLSPEATQNLLQSKPIASVFEKVSKNPNMPESIQKSGSDSFTKWNTVKKELDDQIWAANPNNPKVLQTVKGGLSKTELTGLKEARAKLVSTMDENFPAYAPARKLSEQLTIRGKYLDIMDKIKNPTTKVVDGKEVTENSMDKLYTTFFDTTQKQNEFIKNITKAGGNKDNAKQLVTDLGYIHKSPTQDLIKKAVGSVDVYAGASTAGVVQKFIQKYVEGNYNKELVKLMLSTEGKWQDAVTKALYTKQEPGRIAKVAGVLKDFIKYGANKANNINLIPGRKSNIGLTKEAGKSIMKQAIPASLGLAASQSNE